MSIEEEIVAAWQAAAKDLRIEVMAPFAVRLGGRDRRYLAYIPHFGGRKGMLVAALPYDPSLYGDAKAANYPCSFVNPELYATYERAFFIETLSEWGFTGPQDLRPSWLKSDVG